MGGVSLPRVAGQLSPAPSHPFKGDYIKILSIVFGWCFMGFMGKEPIQNLSFSPDLQSPGATLSLGRACTAESSWSATLQAHFLLDPTASCPGWVSAMAYSYLQEPVSLKILGKSVALQPQKCSVVKKYMTLFTIWIFTF